MLNTETTSTIMFMIASALSSEVASAVILPKFDAVVPGWQVANRAAGDIPYREIDPREFASFGHRLQGLQRRDPEHMARETAQGAAAEAGPAHVLDLVAVDRNHRGAGAERDNESIRFAGQRSAAYSDGVKFVDLDDRQPEKRIAKGSRTGSCGRYACYLL